MTQTLEAIINSLKLALTPPTSYSNGPIVYCPNESESGPGADLKRELWNKFNQVLMAGGAWLSHKQPPSIRYLVGTESDAIEAVLADDPERHDFQAVLFLAQSAENQTHGEAA